MRNKLRLILTLVVAGLMLLPGELPKGNAVRQTVNPSRWSPFGPREDSTIIRIYSDCSAGLAAFQSGQVDISDCPIPSAALSTFASNPDFFVTQPVNSLNFTALEAWDWSQVSSNGLFGQGSSLVPTASGGFGSGSGFWSLLNMRPRLGYLPTNSLYWASGCNLSNGAGCSLGSFCNPPTVTSGCQNVIRRSLSQPTLHLNPFEASTPQELEIVSELYDSMLQVNPATSGVNSQPFFWMVSDVTGLLSFETFTLRGGLYFQDGQPVTGDDVCFSILAYKGISSSAFFSNVANVATCTVGFAGGFGPPNLTVFLTPVTSFDPNTSWVQIGLVPILPAHVWASHCGWNKQPGQHYDNSTVPSSFANTDCSSSTFDPVAAGLMIGSGPWVCNSSIGVSTISGQPSCAQNANGSIGGQALASGSRILLKRNLGYMRCCDNLQVAENGLATSDLQVLEWADGDKDGWVAFPDSMQVSACVNQPPITNPQCFPDRIAYWAHPLFSAWSGGGGTSGTVDIGDVANLASLWEAGMTAPFHGANTADFTSTPPSMLGLDSLEEDPFRLDVGLMTGGLANTVVAYYQGFSYKGFPSTSGVPELELSVIIGTASPSAFTAQVTNPSGAIVGSATGSAGLNPGNVIFTFSGLTAIPLARISISYTTTNVFNILIQ